MANRASWKGSIPVGMVTLHVEAHKANEEDKEKTPLKQVCGCNSPQPFVREEKCIHGKPRLTDDGAKKGLTGTKVRFAAKRPDGSYAPLDPETLKAVEAQINSSEMEPLAIVDAAEVARELTFSGESYYLHHDRKVAGSIQAVAAMQHYLAGGTGEGGPHDAKALIARWSTRGKQHIVYITGLGGVLRMHRVRYTQEQRPPAPEALEVGNAQIAPKVIEMMGQMLEGTLASTFDIAAERDESVPRMKAIVDQALAGELPQVPTEVTPSGEAAPDLMAALEAATAGLDKPKRKAAPTKATQKALAGKE